MPIYQFINPSPLESVEVVQSMRDDHVYIDKDGLVWERVGEVPNAQIDSQINPEDKNAYLRKTENKHLTMGDMMDQGKEMSEKRAEIHGGEDPVQRKYFNDWSKDRKGKKHPSDPKAGGKIY